MSQEFIQKFRAFKRSNKHYNFQLECGKKTYKVHREIVEAKSEYIKTHINFSKIANDGQINSIELHDIDPEIMNIIINLMYEEEEVKSKNIPENVIIKVFIAADFLQCDSIINRIYGDFDKGLTGRKYSIETAGQLLQLSREYFMDNLRGIIFKVLANYPDHYMEIFKALTTDELKTFISTKSPLFYNRPGGNLILFKEYRRHYLELITNTRSGQDLENILRHVEQVLDSRANKNSKLFYGYPCELFVKDKLFGRHPDEYQRSRRMQFLVNNPARNHVKKIRASIIDNWEGSKKISGFYFHYMDCITGKEKLCKTRNDFSYLTNHGEETFELDKDEVITEMTINHGYMIDGIKFTTNKGKTQQLCNNFGGCITELKVNTGEPLEDVHDLCTDSNIDAPKICIGLYGYKANVLLSNSFTSNDIQFIFSGFYNYN